VTGRVLVAGTADGTSLVLAEPVSFWGGVDPHSGEIIDRHHPQSGAITTGRVLVLPHGRGSSSASYVLAECIRAGTGPSGIIMAKPD
jgi:predicted aconitase with swiveling domain